MQRVLEGLDQTIDRLLLLGEAQTVDEAEEKYLDASIPEVVRLLESSLSDDELELIRPELDNYLQAIETLQELDLSAVFSSRLLRVQEGGQS